MAVTWMFLYIFHMIPLALAQAQYPADQSQQGGNYPQLNNYNQPGLGGGNYQQYPPGQYGNNPQYNTNYNPGGNYNPGSNYNPGGNANPNNPYGDLGNPDKYNLNSNPSGNSNPSNPYGDVGNPDKYNNYMGYNPTGNVGGFDPSAYESPYGDFGIRHPIENGQYNWYPNNDDGIPYADGQPYPYQYPNYQTNAGYGRVGGK